MSLRPVEFSFVDTPELCRLVGLPPKEGGYGLLHCVDDGGEHVTAMTADPDYLRLIVSGNGSAALSELEIPPGIFQAVIPGWPDEWHAGSLS